jgi:hypothetical protein
MKKTIVLAAVVVVAFVIFSVLHSHAVTKSSAMASKTASVQTENNPTKQTPKTEEDQSPYVNGKAQFSEMAFDFGYAPINATVFHPFHVVNVGTDTLDIVRIKPG